MRGPLSVAHTTAVMGSIVVDTVERAEDWVPDLSTASGRRLEAELVQLESSNSQVDRERSDPLESRGDKDRDTPRKPGKSRSPDPARSTPTCRN